MGFYFKACPRCHRGDLLDEGRDLHCVQCGFTAPKMILLSHERLDSPMTMRPGRPVGARGRVTGTLVFA